MIEGLIFQVQSEEMVEHLQQRAEHHRSRAAHYTEQAAKFKDELNEIKPEFRMSTGNSNPIEQFESRAKSHRHKASKFEFMSKHVVAGECYRLDDSDLQQIEFTTSEY